MKFSKEQRASRHSLRMRRQSVKKLKVPHGTKRKQRREAAKIKAAGFCVAPKEFKIFWRLGGTELAATEAKWGRA